MASRPSRIDPPMSDDFPWPRGAGSQEAGCRSCGVEFAPDSPLEGAVRCELVSAAGSDSAPYEFLESIKKEGPQPSDALPPFSCNQN